MREKQYLQGFFEVDSHCFIQLIDVGEAAKGLSSLCRSSGKALDEGVQQH